MLPRTYTIGPLRCVAILVLIAFTSVSKVRAHSWAACIDWRFNEGVDENTKGAFTDKKGECKGFARRYNTEKSWGTLDSDFPSRHFLQKKVGDPLACSNGLKGSGAEDSGANEQRANPVSEAYNTGKFGPMTVTKKGADLCLRWPAKTHAVNNERENFVFIRMIKSSDEKRNAKQSDFGAPVAKLPFKNCLRKGDSDKWFCGGCFQLPNRVKPGLWTLQWRWMLNEGEFYTSCADVRMKN